MNIYVVCWSTSIPLNKISLSNKSEIDSYKSNRQEKNRKTNPTQKQNKKKNKKVKIHTWKKKLEEEILVQNDNRVRKTLKARLKRKEWA